MPDPNDFFILTKFIEENTRASGASGIEFVDPRNHRSRLLSMQNHVIFGRRGSGKSTLLRSIEDDEGPILIYLDLEDYKDITFPNILIHLLIASFNKLDDAIKTKLRFHLFIPGAWAIRRRLRNEIQGLEEYLYEPDTEEHVVRTKSETTQSAGVDIPTKVAGVKYQASEQDEIEVSRRIPHDKLRALRLAMTRYKQLFQDASITCKSCPIFLMLDDFYFVDKSIQPELIDYLHRLSKGTNLYLKLATIKHRSFMYKKKTETYIGVEVGHDILDTDLDYTLDSFADLMSFMEQLLDSAIRLSGAPISRNDIFAGEGFHQLCLASGGVPRDFLSLLAELITKEVMPGKRKIGKVEVTEEAIANRNNKLDALQRDSGAENALLEEYLSFIRKHVYTEKRTNAFLIPKPEFDEHPQSRQAIRELVDMRLIHVVDKNTSKSASDGRRYEAFIIDVGLYENSRPRNFNQVDPGVADEKSRKDAIRGAPWISLSLMEAALKADGLQLDLFVTTET